MMTCSKCGKNPAVVFISQADGGNQVGYCLMCAKDMGIKSVNDLIDKMGISEEDIEMMQEQMKYMISPLLDETDSNNDDNDENDFVPGGAPTFPFLQGIFSGEGFGNKNKENKGSSKESTKTDDESKRKKKEKKRKNLDAFCTNFTKKAREGKIDRVIGREKEIARVIQILSRRTKNNPCLIGEPGVGKTAIVEGIALKIAEGNVPFKLRNKEIFLLDLTSLVAGTQFRGQFENRIKGLVEEVKEDGNVILFIDEVHTLVGVGDSEGSMTGANILKPSLSRGEIQVIGATTFKEYRKYIEKDSALERRFQPVTVVEPSVNDTVEMLKGVKSYYEDYHKVRVSDAIVRKAAIFSERYITDRFLPDKAIDLLDEACAAASLNNSKLDEYNTLKDEKVYLENKIEEMSVSENIDYEALAKSKYDLSCIENRLNEFEGINLNPDITEDHLAKVIEVWTGIPASKIRENELKKLADLDKKIKKRIIGQDEAVELVASAIKRSRVQISPRRRPASFIFVGSTGVGKTELVKVLSEQLFDTPETLIRLDMSEFMEKHSVSKIIGAPPGYVGYDEEGQVTEKVRRRPYSVLLFDEIEKAHPDVMNILLQILDEGKVTDAHGRVVNFENTVIIMTSNAGSNRKSNALGFNKDANVATKEHIMKALSEFLRPEFLGRVDEVVAFNNLTKENYQDIAKLLVEEYVKTLDEKGIKFTYDDKITAYLAEKSFGGNSGARDIRNLIRKQVEDKIANVLIEKADTNINNIYITANDGQIELIAD